MPGNNIYEALGGRGKVTYSPLLLPSQELYYSSARNDYVYFGGKEEEEPRG